MKHAIFSGLMIGLAIIFCSLTRTGTQKIINYDDCGDNNPETIRIMGVNPHVPFAIVDRKGIKSATKACCVKWSDKTKIWYSINKWGKIVGTAKVSDSSYYDVTDCYELYLECLGGSRGRDIYISKPISMEYPEELHYEPNEKEKQELGKFTRQQDLSLVDMENIEDNTLQKPVFFKINFKNKGQLTNIKYVVLGGNKLIVAYWFNNQWNASYILSKEYRYKILAVCDINRDKLPEIIFNGSWFSSWEDMVLKINPLPPNNWKVVAKSIGGATI
jgi:hypothetical protein